MSQDFLAELPRSSNHCDHPTCSRCGHVVDNLQLHTKRHESYDRSDQYKCNLCCLGFTKLASFSKHCLRIHNLDPKSNSIGLADIEKAHRDNLSRQLVQYQQTQVQNSAGETKSEELQINFQNLQPSDPLQTQQSPSQSHILLSPKPVIVPTPPRKRPYERKSKECQRCHQDYDANNSKDHLTKHTNFDLTGLDFLPWRCEPCQLAWAGQGRYRLKKHLEKGVCTGPGEAGQKMLNATSDETPKFFPMQLSRAQRLRSRRARWGNEEGDEDDDEGEEGDHQ